MSDMIYFAVPARLKEQFEAFIDLSLDIAEASVSPISGRPSSDHYTNDERALIRWLQRRHWRAERALSKREEGK